MRSTLDVRSDWKEFPDTVTICPQCNSTRVGSVTDSKEDVARRKRIPVNRIYSLCDWRKCLDCGRTEHQTEFPSVGELKRRERESEPESTRWR